jgi:hypothetical protein
MPAKPVPLDQAPRAVREVDLVGKVVVSWRKVSSPNPEESDAREIPKRRVYRPDAKAIVYKERSVLSKNGCPGGMMESTEVTYHDTEPATPCAESDSPTIPYLSSG